MLSSPAEQWTAITVGFADLGDKLRTNRLVQTAAELSAQTGTSLPEPRESNLSSLLARCRFIENEASGAYPGRGTLYLLGTIQHRKKKIWHQLLSRHLRNCHITWDEFICS